MGDAQHETPRRRGSRCSPPLHAAIPLLGLPDTTVVPGYVAATVVSLVVLAVVCVLVPKDAA